MEKEKNSVFKTLNALDVNSRTDKKAKLTYLSWAWAWAEVKKAFPNATYTIWKDEFNNPYTFDSTLGYMCYTTVTIESETLEMWLPVMNGNNKAMLNHIYTYKVKMYEGSYPNKKFKGNYEDKEVEAATMFDINKTIMRCLVKNLAMFGLGLYIYAGEDLPEIEPIPTLEAKQYVAGEIYTPSRKDVRLWDGVIVGDTIKVDGIFKTLSDESLAKLKSDKKYIK